MERNVQKNGLVNLVAAVVVFIAAFVVTTMCIRWPGRPAPIFLGLGALVAFASWFQMRLEENERLEKLEVEELARARAKRRCLKRRTRRFFRRSARANSSRNSSCRPLAGCCSCWKPAAPGCSGAGLPARPRHRARPRHAGAVAVRHFRAVVVFARTVFRDHRPAGKPPVAAARREFSAGRRLYLLRHGAGHRRRQDGISPAGSLRRRALCVLLGLMAAEILVTLLLEIYRPRVKGKIARPLYDSRLVGIARAAGKPVHHGGAGAGLPVRLQGFGNVVFPAAPEKSAGAAAGATGGAAAVHLRRVY